MLDHVRACVSGEQIGAEPTLPYLSPELHGAKLLVGANFASAGVGILNDTGVQFVSSTRTRTHMLESCIRIYNNAMEMTIMLYVCVCR